MVIAFTSLGIVSSPFSVKLTKAAALLIKKIVWPPAREGEECQGTAGIQWLAASSSGFIWKPGTHSNEA